GGDFEGALRRQGAAIQQLAQAGPFDVFHDDEGEAVFGHVHVEDLDDEGMAETANELRFSQEGLDELRAGVEQEFQRLELIEQNVPGAIDDAHAATADFVQNLVFAAKYIARVQVAHGRWAFP